MIKFDGRFTFFLWALLMIPAINASEPTDLEALDRHIFIGQAYPSGHVYVRRFVEKPDPKAEWPKEVDLTPMGTSAGLPPVVRARFVRALESKTEGTTFKTVYIPGDEGMDEDHNPCGLGEIKKKNLVHKKLSGDFFDAILDHCEPNEGIAVFQIEPSSFSFMVFGSDGHFSLSDPRNIEKIKRPLSVSEKKSVELEKKEAEKNAAEYECTTNPAYLDSAAQIFEAKAKGQGVNLRLSTYDTPGCAGHFAAIYVLDVLKKNELFKSFTIYQYRGVI